MMTARVDKQLRIDTICVTFNFGFHQSKVEYSTRSASDSFIQQLYRDAERIVRDQLVGSRTPQVTGRYQLSLYRVSSTEFAMTPIQQMQDVEQNSLIEIVIVPDESNRRAHSFNRCHLTTSTFCSLCTRLITGIYKQGFRCRQCRMIFHRECASLTTDDCPALSTEATQNLTFTYRNFTGPVLPVPGPDSPSPRNIINDGSSMKVLSQGTFPACLRDDSIYRRYAFFLTNDKLIIMKNLASVQYRSAPQPTSTDTVILLSDISNLVLTHYTPNRDDIFEIHLSNGSVISIGKITDPNSVQMATAQFYSFVRDQWEPLLSTAPPPTSSAPPTDVGSTNGANNGAVSTASANPQQLRRRPSSYILRPQDGNENGDLHEIYSITNEMIGEGQFGRVVSAFRKSSHQEVAVKIIEKINSDEAEIQRINDEINKLYKFNHMNILKLEAYFERDNAVYLVTERMQTDMCKYIMTSPNGHLDEDTSRMIIYQVIIALRYLHQKNYAHLDIKCENILLTLLPPVPTIENAPAQTNGIDQSRDFPLVKLADFGYSRFIGEHSFRKTRVGTKIYNAPEIYVSKIGYNRLVDMWSVGIVLYAALSGTLPYREEDVPRAEKIVQEVNILFGDPVWSTISHEAKDLIVKKLLVVQSGSRIGANNALFDDWFSDFTLFKHLREIEKRTVHLLRSKGRQRPSPLKWLTTEREDPVWLGFRDLYVGMANGQTQ